MMLSRQKVPMAAYSSSHSVSKVLDSVFGKFETDDPELLEKAEKRARQGTQVHKILEELLMIPNHSMFLFMLESYATNASIIEPTLYPQAYQNMACTAASWLSRRKAQVIAVEQRVEYTFESGVEMHGIIDAVVQLPTRCRGEAPRMRIVILDWKTSHSTMSHSRYRCQCELYALLYGKQNGIPLRDLRYAVVYLWRSGESAQDSTFTEKSGIQQVRRTESQLLKYLEDLAHSEA